MTDSHAFVVQLDHLIRLLAERPVELDDQKLALHQLHAALATGDVAIVATPTALTANGEPQDGPPAAADGLRGRLVAEGVRRLDVSCAATSADLLAVAQALATTSGLVWLELESVRVDATPEPVVPTPAGVAAVVRSPHAAAGVTAARPTPTSVGRMVRPTATPAPAPATPAPARSAAPLPRPVPRPVPPQRQAPARVSGASSITTIAEATGGPAPAITAEAAGAVAREEGLVNRGDAEGDAALLIRPTPSHAERRRDMRTLVAGLADVTEMRAVSTVLEEVTGRVERATHDGDGTVLRDAFCALVRHERAESRQDVRLATRITIRRLVTPHTMRLVAALLPRQPERREETLDALRAEPEMGADAAMEHLVQAESASDRRAFYSALVKLPASETVVLHMLDDPRWFVVRNAAELAGDLRLRGMEPALVGALSHEDPRVHRAAAGALGRIATPAAVEALRRMLAADDRQVRAAAAVALADARWPRAVATLRTLLAEERDLDARHTLLAALGRIATDEAVEVLVEWSARGRGLFRRTPTATRLAATQALVDAGTDSARIALRTLARDRDRQVAACAQAGVVRTGAKVRAE